MFLKLFENQLFLDEKNIFFISVDFYSTGEKRREKKNFYV